MSIENTQAMPINDVLPHAFNVCVSTKRHPTLIGPSGCGKSQILSEDLRAMLAEHEGMTVGNEEGQFKLWHVDAATTDGAELRGLPDINRDTTNRTQPWTSRFSSPCTSCLATRHASASGNFLMGCTSHSQATEWKMQSALKNCLHLSGHVVGFRKCDRK